MKPAPAPSWLGDFQRAFGAALREPLQVHAGALVPSPAAYPATLRAGVTATSKHSAEARLAVYNWQYWLRLFDLLQQAYPTVTRLLGPWALNHLATAYLLETPPSSHDIDRAADGFAAFLQKHAELLHPLRPVPNEKIGTSEAAGARAADFEGVVLEAAGIDAAWRRVFAACQEPVFTLEIADLGRLASARLISRQSFAVVSQRHPLLQWRADASPATDAPSAVPRALDTPEHWALFRVGLAVGQVQLEAREARLLGLLEAHTIGVALGQLDAELTTAERGGLAPKVSQWLARGVRLGFWTRAE